MSAPVERTDRKTISVVVPCYNEAEVLTEFHERLQKVLDGLGMRHEIIYVNDGSEDGTLDILTQLRGSHPEVGIIDLSRNFGKEAAMTAGIDHADGDALVVIDADLQDPPEHIPQLVESWRQGYDVVYATRSTRNGESWLKRWTAHLFYRLMGGISEIPIPPDTGDFRLLDRRAVAALRQLPESQRFMKGLFSWIGFSQTAVYFDRDPRHAGETSWNYWRLWNLAVQGITSFTVVPLRLCIYLGLLIAAGAFIYGAVVIVSTLLYGNDVAGYPSLLVVILLLGSVQLVSIGILGEYLGRLYMENKRRPLYLISEFREPANDPAGSDKDTACNDRAASRGLQETMK